MAYRRKTNKKSAKKMFSRTASKSHKKNRTRAQMRGGIRL